MRTLLRKLFTRSPRQRAPLTLEMLEQRELMSAGYFDPTFGATAGPPPAFRTSWGRTRQPRPLPYSRMAISSSPGPSRQPPTTTTSSVVRLKPDGTLDQTFGIDGRSYSGFGALLGGTHDLASAVAIDAQGHIVVAGTADTGTNNTGSYFGVIRLQDNGYSDSSFGIGGRSYSGFQDLVGGSYDGAKAVAIDAQGRIVVAGTAIGDSGSYSCVTRLQDNGYSDYSFGIGGRSFAGFSNLINGTYVYGNAVALDAQGNIIVAGTAISSSGVNTFAVDRLQGDIPVAAYAVMDLTGLTFSLTSLDNGSTHWVVIQGQSDNGDGTATITGTWDGQALTGTVQYDANGNIHIVFQWMGGHSGPVHTFYGTTDGYSLDGMVNVLGGGGPGHCVGYETE